MNAKNLLFLSVFFCSLEATAQTPQWIWHANTNAGAAYFRKTFRTPPLTWNARLTVAADDRAEIFLNGVSVGQCSDWQHPMRGEVSVRLNQGENVIAVKAENTAEAAGLLVHLNLNSETNVVSDASWLTLTNAESNWSNLNFNAAHWSVAATIAPHGSQPWGDILFRARATPAENLRVLPGFRVELLRSAEPGEGSWICMTFDDRGRLIISPQGDERRLLRMTLREGKVDQIEKIEAPVRYAMGLLYAFESLYVNGRGPNGSGLYRLIDSNQNDRFETNEVRLLKRFQGDSEHGYHALALGPDKKIYVLNGNGTKLPEGISPESPYRHFAEDALTGSRGENVEQDGTKVPNCHVLQTDPEGREWKLWAGGMRNAYDMDFNQEGELITFDSDMEWDWGTPWYRPTRILHLVSGGEYGWRDGTRMWADHYPDLLPAVTTIGLGSPTGVKFGTRSKFPEKYRRALYAMDWSYGRIVAVHLGEKYSSYTASWEPFVQGTPLNLTSLAFGSDGAMYFVTGGRGTQSGLYRVTTTAEAKGEDHNPNPIGVPVAAREIRRKLEGLHGKPDVNSFDFIVHQLQTANDIYIAHAARVALEAFPVELWKRTALSAKGGISGPLGMLLALARTGDSATALEAANRALQFHGANLLSLRIVEIALSRHPELVSKSREALIQKLNSAYPSSDPRMSQQLCRVLLRLTAPEAVAKTVRLLSRASTQEEQMFFVEQLRNIGEGWTVDDRRMFFQWFLQRRDPKAHSSELLQYFKDVGRVYVDGAYFDRYLRDFRRQAAATLTADEKRQLEHLLTQPIAQGQNLSTANTRTFVREWKIEDLLPEFTKSEKPDLQRGRQALVDAQCLTCHRFGNDGGVAGPELTGVGSKYSARDLLESILEPSKVLSDQYHNHTVVTKEGDAITGRLVADSEKEIVLETDRLNGATERIARDAVAQLHPSTLSPMPEGLVNVLTREEILDLIAYLRSGAGAESITPSQPQ